MALNGNNKGPVVGGTSPNQAIRPSVLIATVLLALACLATGVVFWMKGPLSKAAPEPPPPAQQSQQDSSHNAVASVPTDENVPVLVANGVAAAAPSGRSALITKRPPPSSAPPAPAVARPEPSPYARQLVNNLVNLEPAALPKTPEQIAAWKQNLQQLVQQGAVSLPAIQEFLEKNVDFTFGAEGARALGYGSARAAMYDALAQIGGADAAGVMLGTLRASVDPTDIAMLARSLEQIASQQYRQQILDAARQALALPDDGNANPTDFAPLFDVLAKYGGPGAVAEIDGAAPRWKYYSAIALAQLPDGAGVPALIHMVQDSGNGPVKNIPALQMLAQAATQNSDARTALLQAVRANSLSQYAWAILSPILAGDQIQYLDSGSAGANVPPSGSDVRTFHIAAGNQNFFTAPPAGGLTPDQLNQQLALINEMLAAAPNSAAQQALQSSRDALLKRSAQAAPPPK